MTTNPQAQEGAAVVAKPVKTSPLRPARKQVKAGEVVKSQPVQTGKEYNIWYNKWAGGDREDSYSNKIKSQTRCNIKLDAGLTRANSTGMKYICLFFARGCCPYGWECEYLHTLPDPKVTLNDTSKDCFARDKFADYRDDMGGVGSFNRQNRTLYIGRIKETGTGPETEEVVTRHFKEWGIIERIRVLQYRSVAFVTYIHEVHAQFAKEAMACQSMDNDEILNVRWATEDPNPVQKVAEKERLEQMGQEAVRARMDPQIVDAMRAVRALEDGDVLSDDEATASEDGTNAPQGRSAKRQRLEAEKPPNDEPSQPPGILSVGALEGIKHFAEIRKRNASAPVTRKVPRPTPTNLGLADYGSDED